MRSTRSVAVLVIAVVLTFSACSSDDDPCGPPASKKNPVVVFETSLGEFTVELFLLDAPVTVGNFLKYVDEEFYDGLTFHRVISSFMVQGGGFDENMVQKPPTHDRIPNEADNGLSNLIGTIAMARTADPHSARCQFFINVRDNTALDHRDKTQIGWGYCVFGEVVEGWEVVGIIRNVETTSKYGYNDVPVVPVIINRLYRKN